MSIEYQDSHFGQTSDYSTEPTNKPDDIGIEHAIEELTRQNQRLAIIHQIAKNQCGNVNSRDH